MSGDTVLLLWADGGRGATNPGARMLDLFLAASSLAKPVLEGVLAGVVVVILPLSELSLDNGFDVISRSTATGAGVGAGAVATGFGVGSFENRGMPVDLTGLTSPLDGSMLCAGWRCKSCGLWQDHVECG